jgi:hypothetical protein
MSEPAAVVSQRDMPRRSRLMLFDDWLRQPVPIARIHCFRALVALYSTIYLLVRFAVLWSLGDRSVTGFDPVGIWWWLATPLPAGAVRVVLIVAVVACAAMVVGRALRIVAPTAALCVLALTTYRSSFGQLLWFDNLMVLHLVLLGGWSVVFIRSKDSDCDHERKIDVHAAGRDEVSGFVLRLAALATVITYVLAGVAKLRIGGWAWIDGDALARHIAFSAARLELLGASPSPVAAPILRVPGLLTVAAVVTVLTELLAPLALLGRRWAAGWTAAAWLLHLGVAATMFVVFAYPLVLVAFAPLFRLERLSRWSIARWTRPRQ